MTSWLKVALLSLLVLAGARAQAPDGAPLSDAQVLKMYERTLQLMESGGVFVPDLTRAGRPIVETSRLTLESLKFLGFRNPPLEYRWLSSLRAFLLLADALPKPVPFPEESRRQLAELREILHTTEVYFQSQLDEIQLDLRNPDRDQVKRYADDNLKLPPPRAGHPRVVFLGDSITDAWRLNEYFPDKDFINRGISGQMTGQMLGRFLSDVINLHPAAVLMLAGTNDIARGVDIVTIGNNLTMMADLADHYHVKLILASVLPVHDYYAPSSPAYDQTRRRSPQVIRALDDWIMAFSQKRGYVFLNYYQPMLDVRLNLIKEYSDDGLHPNPAGYRVMAPLALAAIEKALGPAPPAQPQKRRLRLF